MTSTRAALRRTRQSQAPLPETRAAFSAAAEALDATLASGATGRLLVRELRTARELLSLQRRDTEGIDVPDCAQTTSLDADGPHTSGLEFERVDPHGPGTTHMHGHDLTAALEPATRAAAGQPGPHGTHRRPTPHRWVQEPTPSGRQQPDAATILLTVFAAGPDPGRGTPRGPTATATRPRSASAASRPCNAPGAMPLVPRHELGG